MSNDLFISYSSRAARRERDIAMAEIVIRPALPEDIEVLWDFLAIAAYEPDAAAAKTVPIVADHLAGWQRSGDFGFIAEQGSTALGAAWARQFSPLEQPAFYLDDQTPEMSIAVKAQARGRGLGQKLLQAMLSEAARRGVRLCLNVRHDNPALRLYRRMGFRVLPDRIVPNRVGGRSIGMVSGSSYRVR